MPLRVSYIKAEIILAMSTLHPAVMGIPQTHTKCTQTLLDVEKVTTDAFFTKLLFHRQMCSRCAIAPRSEMWLASFQETLLKESMILFQNAAVQQKITSPLPTEMFFRWFSA